MPSISISDKLSIGTGDPQGVIINCLAGREMGVMDVFNVSLFFSSVVLMLENLKQGEPWNNNDNSLVVSVNSEGMTLTFKMQGPPFGEVDVVLNKEDSKKFTYEMAKIAEGN